jgi:hypothetical protein
LNVLRLNSLLVALLDRILFSFAFSADELNIYFTAPAAGTDPPDLAHVTYRPLIEGDSFSFSCILNYIERHWFRRYSTGFHKTSSSIDPSFFTELFNNILTSSTFPLVWKISSVFPISKLHSPTEKLDYPPIFILPVLAKAFENVMYEEMVD